jgi:ureidoacrylate peracid hydrolase
VFRSTNIDYVLRNLRIEQLVITGQMTDQCIESAVRDAADSGYFVTVVNDACSAHSEEDHERGLQGMKGFCRIRSTTEVLNELGVKT